MTRNDPSAPRLRYRCFPAAVPVLAMLAILSILTATPAAGQEAEDDERWSAELGFTLNATGGNEDLTVLTSQVGLTHLLTSAFEADLSGRARYGRSQGEKVAENLRGNLTVDLWPEAEWSPFVFVTAERDPFRRLDARLNGGTGVKRTFLQDGWNEVSLSGAVLYSYENLEVEPVLGHGVSHTARWSWRGRARREFGEGRRFEQVVFYQPAWDEFDDYLMESQTSARWALSRTLAFTTSFLYERNSTPAPDVAPDDWALAVGLTMATRW